MGTLRKGIKEDLPEVLELIRELAIFENAPHAVDTTVESMEKDGFGPNPLYHFYVVVEEEEVVGLSLYYFRYSTWKGKRLYLEDLIVREDQRGKGFGKMLFEMTGKAALEENCSGMVWQVLDWNKGAIEFYKNYGSQLDGEWVNCSIDTSVFAT